MSKHRDQPDEPTELHPMTMMTEDSPIQWNVDYRPDLQKIVTDTHTFSLDQPVVDNTAEGKAEREKAEEEAEKLSKAKSGIDSNPKVLKDQPEET